MRCAKHAAGRGYARSASPALQSFIILADDDVTRITFVGSGERGRLQELLELILNPPWERDSLLPADVLTTPSCFVRRV